MLLEGQAMKQLPWFMMLWKAVVVAALVVGACAFAQEARTTQNRSFSGVISCSTCLARHNMHSGKSPAECTTACVRKGASFVLVAGEKVFFLQGKTSELGKFAGQRVKIDGVREGDKIHVLSVSQGL
jgi:hypothetical protein